MRKTVQKAKQGASKAKEGFKSLGKRTSQLFRRSGGEELALTPAAPVEEVRKEGAVAEEGVVGAESCVEESAASSQVAVPAVSGQRSSGVKGKGKATTTVEPHITPVSPQIIPVTTAEQAQIWYGTHWVPFAFALFDRCLYLTIRNSAV